MIPNFKKMPALNALVAFEAVARHGSFTRAAEELCITHGAVSHRIRQVEEHLRTQLFVRSSKRTLLTPKGQVFLQVVRETLNRLQDAAANVRENVRGLLQLSVMPSFASRWLLDHITDFYRRHPGVDVEIQTSSVLANLNAGEADVGVVYGPTPDAKLHSYRLSADRIFPVASFKYLRSFRPVKHPAELREAVFLRHRELSWAPWFEAAKLPWSEPAAGSIFSDIGLMCEAAIGGQGIALGRTWLVREALESGRLIRLTDVTAPSDWNLHLVHTPEAGARPFVQLFVQWVLENFPKPSNEIHTNPEPLGLVA